MPLHCWIKLTLTVPFPPVVELGTQQSLGQWQKWGESGTPGSGNALKKPDVDDLCLAPETILRFCLKIGSIVTFMKLA